MPVGFFLFLPHICPSLLSALPLSVVISERYDAMSISHVSPAHSTVTEPPSYIMRA